MQHKQHCQPYRPSAFMQTPAGVLTAMFRPLQSLGTTRLQQLQGAC